MLTLSSDARAGLKHRFFLLVLIVLAFLPTWLGLAHIWSHTFGYAHGWLIALISAWLLFSNETKLYPAKFSASALVFLTVALFMWAFARFSFTDIAAQMMLPVLAVSIAYSLYGATGARSVAFAAFYILFAVPIWDVMIPFLQQATVFGVTHALSIVGIPNKARGNFIDIPFGSFHVERGCSGANFVIVAIAVGVLNARAWAFSRRKGLFAVAFITCLSVFANWVRVFIVVLRSWSTDMQTTLIENHYWLGWYLFAGALVLYFIVARMLDEGAKPKPLPSLDPKAPRAQVLAQFGLTVALLAIMALYTQARLGDLANLSLKVPAAPVLNGTWNGPEHTQTVWQPRFPGAKAHVVAIYQKASGRELVYYRAFYTDEHEGSKLIGWGVSAVPQGWHLLRSQYLKLNKSKNYTYSTHAVLLQEVMSRHGALWLIESEYKLGNAHYAHPLKMKLAQGLALFSPSPPEPSEVVALAVPCFAQCRNTEKDFLSFNDDVFHN